MRRGLKGPRDQRAADAQDGPSSVLNGFTVAEIAERSASHQPLCRERNRLLSPRDGAGPRQRRSRSGRPSAATVSVSASSPKNRLACYNDPPGDPRLRPLPAPSDKQGGSHPNRPSHRARMGPRPRSGISTVVIGRESKTFIDRIRRATKPVAVSQPATGTGWPVTFRQVSVRLGISRPAPQRRREYGELHRRLIAVRSTPIPRNCRTIHASNT
jgi:hypothetical protein